MFYHLKWYIILERKFKSWYVQSKIKYRFWISGCEAKKIKGKSLQYFGIWYNTSREVIYSHNLVWLILASGPLKMCSKKRRLLFTLIFNSNLSVKKKGVWKRIIYHSPNSFQIFWLFESAQERNLSWNVYILTLSTVLWRSITLDLKHYSNAVTTSYDTRGCYPLAKETLEVKRIGYIISYSFYSFFLFFLNDWVLPMWIQLMGR